MAFSQNTFEVDRRQLINNLWRLFIWYNQCHMYLHAQYPIKLKSCPCLLNLYYTHLFYTNGTSRPTERVVVLQLGI